MAVAGFEHPTFLEASQCTSKCMTPLPHNFFVNYQIIVLINKIYKLRALKICMPFKKMQDCSYKGAALPQSYIFWQLWQTSMTQMTSQNDKKLFSKHHSEFTNFVNADFWSRCVRKKFLNREGIWKRELGHVEYYMICRKRVPYYSYFYSYKSFYSYTGKIAAFDILTTPCHHFGYRPP